MYDYVFSNTLSEKYGTRLILFGVAVISDVFGLIYKSIQTWQDWY